MATGGQKGLAWDLVNVGVLTLEEADEYPMYISIVVCQDKIVVLNRKTYTIQIHRLHDEIFLASSDRLESVPCDMCLMDATTICVLHENGLIQMMSIDSTDMSLNIKTTRTLRLHGVLDEYDGVVRFRDRLVISGVKHDTMYWCVVSIDDGHVDTIHQICKREKWSWSHVTTKDDMIYISCRAGGNSPDNTGVYGFDILNPSQCKYTYKHQRLQWPTSVVTTEDGNIFVCNEFLGDSCIHQLTASCQLVSIFTKGIPLDLTAIFWDNGRLYGTRYTNHNITVFRPVYQGSHTASEVLVSDERKHPVIEETAIRIGQGNVDKRQSIAKTEMTPSGPAPDDTEEENQEITTGWNYTVEDLFEAWQSVEDYILEELAPGIILPFFEKEGLLSSEEFEKMLKLRRRQMAEKLLKMIKAKLPDTCSSLFHALNKTEQYLIVQGLRQKIESTHDPQPMSHDQETNVMVTGIVYYTLTLELLKDGNIMNDVESKTIAYLHKGCIFFDHCMRSECLTWKAGSIIICLKPLGSLTKEGLRFFCVHNGIKNFVSDLLTRKIIFSSIPEGEMIVHVQVHCYDEDPNFEGTDGQSRDYTQLNCQASFTVTDNPEMIKNNLSRLYDTFLEEIDPLHFKDTFVTREILDLGFFKGLQNVDKRRKRAAHFLRTVMDKDNTALAALVHALICNGYNYLANELCTVQESSSQFRDEGQSDPSSVDVVATNWTTHAQEPMLCSCMLKATVRKNEDGTDDRKQLLIAERSAKTEQGIQTNDPIEQIYCRISDLNAPDKHKLLLPPGKKYHVFFSYASQDINWVKETVERLENDHGFVCCEYDRNNTPGTLLLSFAADAIKYAIKTVVVMTKEAFKSGFVDLEIQMALQQRCETGIKCVVPVLLQDCTVPDYLRILNYVDARDPTQRDIWWPKLLKELQPQAGDYNAPEVIGSNQGNQHLSEETFTQLGQDDDDEGPSHMWTA